MAPQPSLPHETRVTGQDAVLKYKLAGSYKPEVPITNVEWQRDAESTRINDRHGPYQAIAEGPVSFSGSFEFDGRITAVYDDFVRDDGRTATGTISLREIEINPNVGGEFDYKKTTYSYVFENVHIPTFQRELPADDLASVTVDFEAETMTKQQSSSFNVNIDALEDSLRDSL